MPLGLMNSIANFMRWMDDILWPLTNSFVVVYLDDILIFNKILEEHLQHIQLVLHTLRESFNVVIKLYPKYMSI
jgi:hypothetical protein